MKDKRRKKGDNEMKWLKCFSCAFGGNNECGVRERGCCINCREYKFMPSQRIMMLIHCIKAYGFKYGIKQYRS